MNTLRLQAFTLITLLSLFCLSAQANNCPQWLNTDVKKLRSDNTINLCDIKQNKVLLIVNTASECGFTPQFEGLEKLYQQYKDQGFEIIGFPSDSFWQEHDDSEKTAEICYVNYGVTFTMLESSKVRGSAASTVFKKLGKATSSPKWNFYKYLIDRQGNIIENYSSATKPLDAKLTKQIETLLKQP